MELELLAAGAIDRSKSFAAWKLELESSGYRRVRFSGKTVPEFPEDF